jgi:hypothetical protein
MPLRLPGRYSARRRSLTNAAAAPSNSGSVQINAVAIKRSDNTSHACSSRDLVTRLVNGRTASACVAGRVVIAAPLECFAIRSGRALSNTALRRAAGGRPTRQEGPTPKRSRVRTEPRRTVHTPIRQRSWLSGIWVACLNSTDSVPLSMFSNAHRRKRPSYGGPRLVRVGCRGSRFSKRAPERVAEHFPRRDEERGQNRTQDEAHRPKQHEAAEG